MVKRKNKVPIILQLNASPFPKPLNTYDLKKEQKTGENAKLKVSIDSDQQSYKLDFEEYSSSFEDKNQVWSKKTIIECPKVNKKNQQARPSAWSCQFIKRKRSMNSKKMPIQQKRERSTESGDGTGCQSINEIRRRNFSLMKCVHDYRQLSPQVSKNLQVLRKQQVQMSKIKHKISKCCNIKYLLGLEKKGEYYETQASESKRCSPHRPLFLSPTSHANQYSVHKKDLYAARKNQEELLRKQTELDAKIQQYKQRLAKLQEKQKLISYPCLLRRIQFLKWDIDRLKQYNLKMEKELSLDLNQLTNETKQTEAKTKNINEAIENSIQNANAEQKKGLTMNQQKGHLQLESMTCQIQKELVGNYSKKRDLRRSKYTQS